MSWPQHNKAKCGSVRGQDSYLVPMLSYLPCAILDILRDLCTQLCMHPLLPWVIWGLGYVKSQEGERITKLAIPASLWSMWAEKEGGWIFWMLALLPGLAVIHKDPAKCYFLYILPFHISFSDFPSSKHVWRDKVICSLKATSESLSLLLVLPSTKFSWHFFSFSKSPPLRNTPYLSSVICGAFGTHQ